MRKYILLTSAGALFFSAPALAQTTAGVFGPGISENDRSGQFRIAMSPGQNDGTDRWESRIHYQQAISDNLRSRIVLQGSNLENGSFESNFIQAELQWQFKKPDNNASWSSALRLDARFVEQDDGENRLGLNWTNQWNPGDKWQFNNVILTAVEIGNDVRDGLVLEVRNGVKYRINADTKVGVESFSALGRTNALGNFNTQNHRIGPVVTGKINDEISYLAGALFGASKPARDIDFRFWLGRKF